VILGHSERRQLFGETDEALAAQAPGRDRGGLEPILCVGETEEERDPGAPRRCSSASSRPTSPASARGIERVVIAYEPIWAIGTGADRDSRTGRGGDRVRSRAVRGRAAAARSGCGSSTAAR
jgi:triosephosphate isomerase